MAGFGDELKSRLPELALSIMAGLQGPQALGALQGGMAQARDRSQELARQAQLDEERRQQAAAVAARAERDDARLDEQQQMQKLQAALGLMDRYAGDVGTTATDPVAAENAILSRGAGLESAFGLSQGQLSPFVPNMSPRILAQKKRVAKEKLDAALKLYGPEALQNDSITIDGGELLGQVKPSQLMQLAEMPTATDTGGSRVPFAAAGPTVPNTPEEQFYATFAQEHNTTWEKLPRALKAQARKEWMQSDDRPQRGGPTDYQQFNMGERLAAAWSKTNAPVVEMDRQLRIMRTGLQRFRAGDTNGGAQAVLVTFQKILDPTSVVRESEYARTASGQSMLNRIQGYAQRLEKGGAGLTDGEMAAMVQTAEAMFAEMASWKAGARRRIESTAREFNINPALVFDDVLTGGGEPASTAPVAPSTPAGGRPAPTGATYDEYLKSRGQR